jgi:hypothetical protein
VTDIAQIGLSIDSRPILAGVKALDDLTAAAKPANAAVAALEKTADSTATANKNLASATSKAAATGVAELTKSTSLARFELINLSRQFQDVGVSLASGQSPLLVAVQQGTQIADVFASSTGTVGGFVKQVASGIASVITPARLLVGGIAAIGLTAVTSAVSWQSAQRDIQIGLLGIGRASKASAGDINEIASATSSLRGLSATEAREVATTLASTGKIGVENIKLLTAETKNFAVALGLDVPKAAEAIATIFSNPTEGAKQLAAKIGGIDAATLKYIETLEQQGDRQGAIKALADATLPAIAGAADKTGSLAKGWTLVSNAASNAFTSIGKALNQIGTGGLDEQSESALDKQRKDLEALVKTYQTAKLPDFDTRAIVDQLSAVNDALTKIQTNRKAALGVEAAQTTLQVAPIVSSLAPAPELIRQVNANLEAMTHVLNDPSFESFRQKVGDQLPQALARLSNQAAALQLNPRLADPIQSQIDSIVIQNKLLSDQSPALRQRVAYQLAYNDAIKQGASAQEAVTIATERGKQAFGGIATVIQQQQAYLSLLGQTATVEEQVRSIELNLQAARLQGVTIDGARADTLKRLASEQALGITQIKASTDAQNVEAATVGLSAGAAAEYAAAQNAINEARRSGRELTQDNISQIQREASALGEATNRTELLRSAYTGLVQGPLQTLTQSIASGSTFFDALKKSGVSALNSIASKLADIAAQNLWKSAFGGSAGDSVLSFLGIGGGSAPTSSGTSLAAGTGGLPFPQFANGTDNAPGGLALINEGNRGEIVDLPNGSRVIPHDVSLRLAANSNSSAQNVHVTVGIEMNANGQWQGFVKDIAQSISADTVSATLDHPSFVDRVASAGNRARSRRLG